MGLTIAIIAIIVLAIIVLIQFVKLVMLNYKVGYYEYFIKKYRDRFDKEQLEFIDYVMSHEYFSKKIRERLPKNN
jgi:hypothetical protein